MKRLKKPSKMILFVALLLSAVFTASAADFEVDGFAYNIIGDNEVEVTSRDSVKYSGEVMVPSTVVNDGVTYQVTRIGSRAFSGCSEMTLVDIPEGITSIGEYAFNNCSELQSMDFPNSLISIEARAFYNCTGLTGFYITRNVADIHEEAFHHCSNVINYLCNSMNAHFRSVNGILYSKDMTTIVAYPPAAPATSFDIPESVTKIRGLAFFWNHNLENINIPESVTWIGFAAFASCEKLTSVVMPDGVTHMGKSVCINCPKLTYVHIPASVDLIFRDAFAWCSSLTEITIPRNVVFIDEFSFNTSGFKSITFEEGSRLQYIGQRAFEMCPLESFDMPNTVTDMGAQVFGYCRQLKSIHLSDNLTTLETSTFLNCFALQELEVPASVTEIKSTSIHDCRALTHLKIGDKNAQPGTTIINSYSIRECSVLELVEFGANVDSISYYAFADNDNLQRVICWGQNPPKCDATRPIFSPRPQDINAVLYVPKASLEVYRTANQWKNFPTILPIEDVGDVNGNGSIEIGDVTTLIDQLLANETTYSAYADVNLDGSVSIADVTALIDKLLSGNN